MRCLDTLGGVNSYRLTLGASCLRLGFDVVDAGPLRNARYLEPMAGLNIYLGYGAGLGTAIAPTWMHKP